MDALQIVYESCDCHVTIHHPIYRSHDQQTHCEEGLKCKVKDEVVDKLHYNGSVVDGGWNEPQHQIDHACRHCRNDHPATRDLTGTLENKS